MRGSEYPDLERPSSATLGKLHVKFTILDIIANGEPGEPCRYSASDPTDGDYLTAEYNVSVPFLGANMGFHKFQASYHILHVRR